MNKKDKDRINKRYSKRFKKHGITIESLASGTEERRNNRFKILQEVGISKKCSILDVGCGFADFYSYLNKSIGSNFNYTGLDINEDLVNAAKTQYPDLDLRVGDLLDLKIERFDYVVSTSCFNIRLLDEDNYEFIEKMLRKSYEIAKKGVAYDFLTSYVDFQGNPDFGFYYSPEKIFSISKKISKRITLRHDYPLFEFCIYIFPDFRGWNEDSVRNI